MEFSVGAGCAECFSRTIHARELTSARTVRGLVTGGGTHVLVLELASGVPLIAVCVGNYAFV